jgi:hypothetical protein
MIWAQETPDRWVSDGACVYRTVNVAGWVVAIHGDPTRWLMQDERQGIFRRFQTAQAGMRAAENG